MLSKTAGEINSGETYKYSLIDLHDPLVLLLNCRLVDELIIPESYAPSDK